MAKLAPAPTQPVDLLPAERRRESQILPDSAALSRNGPATNRDSERLAIVANLTKERPTPISQMSEPVVATPRPYLSSSTPTQAITEAPSLANEASTAPVGLFSRLKEKFLELTGIGASNKNAEPGEEKQGFFARVANQFSKLTDVRSLVDLGSWAKDMASACVPRFRSWIRPTQKAPVPQSLNIKPPTPTLNYEEPKKHTETVIMVPPKETTLELDGATKTTQSLTEKALATVAAAKQAQNEEKEKKEAREEDTKRHNKESVDAALRKLQLEGLSATELAAISAELHGVYGSADVALRNANDLLRRKKVS